MYSLVVLAAMTAGPEVPSHLMCPVTPSNYGCGFWSKHCFYDCCAPARYGWVDCWSKGFGAYPGGGRGFCGGCCSPSFGPFYHPSPCACNSCGSCGSGYGYGGSCGPMGSGFCGYGWPVGNQPAYYAGVIGCPPCMSGPPYAYYTNHAPCCNLQFAFDTGLIGHSHGVGYAGFGGTGNFGFYGAVPMMHKPTTADLPPFPKPEYPTAGLSPLGPVPMPPLPGARDNTPTPGTSPVPPDSLLPPPMVPGLPPIPAGPDAKKDQPKTDAPKSAEPKKESPKRLDAGRPQRATVVLSVPSRATITVEGEPLKSTGGERSFRTPELPPGKEFAYTVRAVIDLNGREEVEVQKVTVTAGETSRASFEKLFAKVESAAARSLVDSKGGK